MKGTSVDVGMEREVDTACFSATNSLVMVNVLMAIGATSAISSTKGSVYLTRLLVARKGAHVSHSKFIAHLCTHCRFGAGIYMSSTSSKCVVSWASLNRSQHSLGVMTTPVGRYRESGFPKKGEGRYSS